MKKINVLLAGIGGYGRGYLNEFLDGNDSSIVLKAVADPFAASSPRFEELKARNIPVFQSPVDFFAEKRVSDEAIDLTVISSPIHTHYPYILACKKNRSHVLCEKPVTGSLGELDELMAKEKETGLFVSVGFQLCFSGGTLALKKDILDGVFGRPLEFKALKLPRRGTKYYQRNGWAGKLSFEGSSILDSPLQNACSHDIQVMLFLLGDRMRTSVPVESVTAETWQGRPDIENYDAAALRLKAAGGLKIHFYTAHCVEENTKSTGEFRFENAVVKWTESEESVFTACFNDGRVKSYEGFESKRQYQKIYNTIDAIRSGIPPVCTLETVRPHLQCVTMVQQQPIIKVPAEKISMVNLADGDSFYYVPGLAEAFLSAYEKDAMPSEIGFIC
ncbi:MAG: Gfo/Idh/MocA family oxidoreductase [Treponema sp.]|jgi:predicted dehydrogenase|nr:Gfo/Idh/MocA family oxidoreductase [Treponema sp.]